MTVENKPDVRLDLVMQPQQYWETYEALRRDGAVATVLGEDRLEALARLVRELSENACQHRQVTSPGELIGHLSLLTFELRLGGPAFDSKKQAAGRNTGGLCSSDAVPPNLVALASCGTTPGMARIGREHQPGRKTGVRPSSGR